MNRKYGLVTLGLTWLLSGCPAVMFLHIDNQSEAPVDMRYDTGMVVRIPPMASAEETFIQGCQRFRILDVEQEYSLWFPPREYVRPNIFSSTLDARVTAEGELLFYNAKRPDLLPLPFPKGACGSRPPEPGTVPPTAASAPTSDQTLTPAPAPQTR